VKRIYLILILFALGYTNGLCQATVFSLFQDPSKEADQQFTAGNYTNAVTLYTEQLAKTPNDVILHQRLAQACYRAKDYSGAISAYNHYTAAGQTLAGDDLFYYAEANATLGNRTVALDYYKRCLAKQPDNELLIKKIWRLNNIQYLYEDSAHYAVRALTINTTAGELCAVPYTNGFVFSSNRKGADVIEKVNRKLNTPFYKLYQATWAEDTATRTLVIAGKPMLFGTSLKSVYNIGAVAFYDHDEAMVFVAAAEQKRSDGVHTLGLHFARKQGRKWKVISHFPHNSSKYSIHDVSVSRDGQTLYFSSDMEGGIGGKDLYTSQWTDGQWTKPRNLGEPVNTPMNEAFPYIHGSTLYFSSDGQPGMGQLDIFKTHRSDEGFADPENMGYPINSHYDDFGLALDSLGNHGYLTSNRKNGRYDDDLYEIDMDLQTYPLTVAAILKYKEHSGSNAAILPWPKATAELVDSETGKAVYKTTTDSKGNVSIIIPYASRYYVRITDKDGVEYKASFELGKYRKEDSVHEIVIIKDIFKKHTDRK